MNGNLCDARILIIDDERINILLLERMLQHAGYTNTRSISDSRQTIDTFEAFQPDIVLLDLFMPYVDGFSVLKELRKRIPIELYLPIIVVTADVSPKTKQQVLNDGAQEFIAKPINRPDVLSCVHAMLQTRFCHLQQQQAHYR